MSTPTTDADWLEQAARYFEKLPTGGEDMAFWANTANAERCRSIAAALRASSGVEVSTEAGPGFACEWDDGEYTIRWDDGRSLTAFASGKVFALTSGHIPRSYTIEGLSSPFPTVEVTEEMQALVRLINDSPHPEKARGSHLTDNHRAQLAYAFIDNIKAKAIALSQNKGG